MNTLLSALSYLNVNSFYFINHGLDNKILDILMPLITDFGSILAWGLILVLMYAFGDERTRKIAFLAFLALILANVVVYSLKFLVAEPRPFLTLANVDLLVHAEETYSFPSGHATSSFAAAFVIGSKYKLNLKGRNYSLLCPLMIFAVIVGFSRVYIGVHYPYDVIVGAIIGILSGYFVLKFWNNNLTEKISRINIRNNLKN